MATTMRAKMRVTRVQIHEGCESLSMSAVSKLEGYPQDGSDEDNSFARFTPSAELNMSITNPDLLGKFAEGDVLYLDFTPAV